MLRWGGGTCPPGAATSSNNGGGYNSSAFPLPWGVPAEIVAGYVVKHPELAPDGVARRFGRRRRGSSSDEGAADDYPPVDDLSHSRLTPAATVAVETVSAVKQKLFQVFVESYRRDPSGSSVLQDCATALEHSSSL